jgi:hypothetical protein
MWEKIMVDTNTHQSAVEAAIPEAVEKFPMRGGLWQNMGFIPLQNGLSDPTRSFHLIIIKKTCDLVCR